VEAVAAVGNAVVCGVSMYSYLLLLRLKLIVCSCPS
jgi:hypothetical protein